MTPIANRLELDAVRAHPCAVLFFWVNWSTFSIQSRANIKEAITLRQSETSQEQYFVVDVSEQSGELWDTLQRWLEADEMTMNEVLWSGSGPLLWLRSGRVVHQMIDPMNYAPADIAAIADSVFKPG
jgi:hypothetical protein